MMDWGIGTMLMSMKGDELRGMLYPERMGGGQEGSGGAAAELLLFRDSWRENSAKLRPPPPPSCCCRASKWRGGWNACAVTLLAPHICAILAW